jgi:co-chaperonin GroES (HSP10)
MKLSVRGKRVAVEKVKKGSNANALFSMPETEEFTGVVQIVGAEAGTDLKPGQKVYFGTVFQKIRMNGNDYLVMDESNIVAIADEA